MPTASRKERVERRRRASWARAMPANRRRPTRATCGAMRLPVLVLAWLGAAAVRSAAAPPPPDDSPARAALVLAIGAFDAGEDQQVAELGLRLRRCGKGWLQPLAGGMATSAGAVNAFLGLSAGVRAGRHVDLRFSFAPGYYAKGGGKDLGHAIEFRSAIGVAVGLGGRRSIGIEYAHLSNGGLGRRNPGEESLVLTLALPLGRSGRNAKS